MAQQHGRGVLRAHLRVAALRLAGDALDLAQKDAGKVEDVDADIEDREPLLGEEIGLRLVDVEAGAEGDPRPGGLADRTRAQHLRHREHRPLEAEILVHGEEDAGFARCLDHGDAVVQDRGEGFLHDRPDPGAMRPRPARGGCPCG